jgi:hypothetical protein
MRSRSLLAVLALPSLAATAGAQSPASPAPPAQQIASAVLPLPEEFRASATVMGYGAGGKLAELRGGNGPFVCLATDPKVARFHVACYHRSLEPFMARGRALRAEGVTGDQVDSVRFRDVRAGRLRMPQQPAALYSLTGTAPEGARPLFVIYVPGATSTSTGLSAKPAEGTPWIMFPGTPKAHIMLVPKM